MLLDELRRRWPGAYALTDGGQLVFVPAPLDARGEHLLFHGFDAPAAALQFAPAGGVAIDIGANLGEWAVPLARAVGRAGHVLCCEPNPEVAAALRKTLAINNLAQARVLPVAVSRSDGAGHLRIDAHDSGQSRLADSGISVALRTLDAVVAESALKRVDLLKIDVEGHEAAVLDGAARTLRELRPAVIFESGHESAAERHSIADRLDDSGYEIAAVLHHYGALDCGAAEYRAAAGPCAGTEARNLLALPPRQEAG
ncbi:MAG: FkbM family methyltransferase [Alphaproteobacteria bacterium]|nr:FkbM family methyltransferase [Alphaproteobacteria bacterium]